MMTFLAFKLLLLAFGGTVLTVVLIIMEKIIQEEMDWRDRHK